MTIPGRQTLALRASVRIRCRLVLELVREKSIGHAHTRKPLLDSAIGLNPWTEKFDILLMSHQDVLAAGIAGIHHHLAWRLAQSRFDLLHSRSKIFVIRCGLPHLQSDRDAMGSIGGDLDVIAQTIMPITVAHDPRLRICCANPGLPRPGTSIARALGLADLLDIEQSLLETFNPFPPSALTGGGLPGRFLFAAGITHSDDMLTSRGQMLPNLLLLFERTRPGPGGDLRAVMHDALQGNQPLRTQDPEYLREYLVQRARMGQAKVGEYDD